MWSIDDIDSLVFLWIYNDDLCTSESPSGNIKLDYKVFGA